MFLILFLFGAWLVLWFLNESRQSKKRPPGPLQFPALGSMPAVALAHPVGFIALDKLRKKYGDVMSIRLGLVDYVFVQSFDTIKKFYGGEDCVDRPVAGVWLERNFYKYLGIIFNNGHGWAEIRKFSTKALRINGFMNRPWLRKILREELSDLVKHIDEELDSSPEKTFLFSASGVIKLSFTNLICATVSSKRHKYTDKQLMDLVDALEKFFRASTLGISLMMAYPWMRFIFGKKLGYYTQLESMRGVHEYSRGEIAKRKEIGKYKTEPECFIDAFLQKMDETKDDPNTLYTEEQFLVTMSDFFTAGSETTANWILFAILLLATHPEKQQKLYEEIKHVIGDRPPEIEDKDRMIYTQAVMLEIHRWAKVAISVGPRLAVKDIEHDGKIIKKGTTILTNLYPIFNDKEYWGDPDVFRPERFMGTNGELTKFERIIPFGYGKRICFGEILAKESGFVYLTTLCQLYEFALPEDGKWRNPSLKLIEGITTCPEDYMVKMMKRVDMNR